LSSGPRADSASVFDSACRVTETFIPKLSGGPVDVPRGVRSDSFSAAMLSPTRTSSRHDVMP
jgi:hypothetical protein